MNAHRRIVAVLGMGIAFIALGGLASAAVGSEYPESRQMIAAVAGMAFAWVMTREA